MIINHTYKFIFIKSAKAAGTSIEVFLSQYCSDNDVVTPVYPHVEPHVARNYKGFWNPFREIYRNRGRNIRKTVKDFIRQRRFYNHMTARVIRARIPSSIWNSYFKFCVERNPWDKTLSYYHMLKSQSGGALSLDQYFKSGQFCLNVPKYTDDDGSIIVNRIIRYENLSAELGEVFRSLGIPFDGSLGVTAKSEYRTDRTPYRNVFTREQKEIIERVFQKEIEIHGYSF
jgi:hypothetical protein